MLPRFAAACTVASVIIAAGAIVSLLVAPLASADARLVTTIWCMVPVAWGLWAMLAPARWVPHRLPVWGAILGVLAGIGAGVLDLPLRIAGVSGVRWLAVVVGPIFYYLLWLLVRRAFGALYADRPLTAANAASP